MWPDHPVGQVSECPGLFWVDEAVEVDMGFDAAEGKLPVIAPIEKEIQDFLAGSTLAKDKEFYLRLRLWWKANDAWRFVPDAKRPSRRSRCKTLRPCRRCLMNPCQAIESLRPRLRESWGNFDQCLLLLSYQFEEGYDWAVGFIMKLAEENVRAVKGFTSAN